MPKKRTAKPPAKRRNPLALNPLLKKSHAHTKSKKAERAKDKQALKKDLAKGSSEV